MPRNKRTEGKQYSKSERFEFKGFISFSMTEEEKHTFREWSVNIDAEWLMQKVEELVDRSYKFTWSASPMNDSVVATLTCANGALADYGYALSGFAPDMWTALRVLMFKHTELLKDGWLKTGRVAKERSEIG